MITLAERDKVLPYGLLMSELELKDVRELEDFVINHCIYAGALAGKLDQKRGRLEVEYAAGRDVHPEVRRLSSALSSAPEGGVRTLPEGGAALSSASGGVVRRTTRRGRDPCQLSLVPTHSPTLHCPC